MELEIIKMAAGQGLFAVLFVLLLFYVLNDSKKREIKYQETITKNQDIISSLTEKFCIVDDIKLDVAEIKKEMIRGDKFEHHTN